MLNSELIDQPNMDLRMRFVRTRGSALEFGTFRICENAHYKRSFWRTVEPVKNCSSQKDRKIGI